MNRRDGTRPAARVWRSRGAGSSYREMSKVSFGWIVAGQLAHATRDQELLALTDELHRETLTQIKWLKTQVKQASPQALAVGADSS